jgi:TolB-like protein/tetratricopeptide (TPR) repeat protein
VFALKPEVDAWLHTTVSEPRHRPISVAVLPFLNLAEKPGDRFFGDGLADDLINELVRLPGLHVIARTSSFAVAAEGLDVRAIGARLSAAWLVEGSVRRDGQRVRVSAQLVSTRDGGHAWTERYDRDLENSFTLQNEIAQAIAQALKITLRHDRVLAAPRDPVAYELWVKGRSLSQVFTPAAVAEASACYEAAITRAPLLARPHFGLADLLFGAAKFGIVDPQQVLPRARSAIIRSLELDDRSGEAHALLGVFRGILDYDWPGAEAAFRRALELSPGSASVLAQHAWFFLVPRLQLPAAVTEAQQAVALDPLSAGAHGYLGLVLLVARQYRRARAACRTAAQLAPGLLWLRWFYGTTLLFAGDVEEGLRECWQVARQLRHPLVIGCMAAVCGLFSQRREAAGLLRELEDMADRVSVPPQAFAMAYLGLGDDRVFEWLDRAITARDTMATHLASMPLYDGLRHDPRFAALLARMGLA